MARSRRHPNRPTISQSSRVRIIAGKWRSRLITFPTTEGLRPTGDRVRETLFNWLTADLPGSRCLDAFAGSGALGFEALSRGAAEVTFVESNRDVIKALQETASELRAEGVEIVCSDVISWLGRPQGRFDIIFLDPPFSLNLHQSVIAAVEASDTLKTGTLIYVETPASEPVAYPSNWQQLKSKRTGGVHYELIQVCRDDGDA